MILSYKNPTNASSYGSHMIEICILHSSPAGGGTEQIQDVMTKGDNVEREMTRRTRDPGPGNRSLGMIFNTAVILTFGKHPVSKYTHEPILLFLYSCDELHEFMYLNCRLQQLKFSDPHSYESYLSAT